MNKFKRKYRSDSLRLQGYDYANEGLYFLTICTAKHKPYLGKVKDGIIQLNSLGKIVAHEWQSTEKIRARVKLGEWVVMPNHIHGIIYLKPKRRDALNASQLTTNPILDGRGPSLQMGSYKNEFGPQKNNIPSIIRGFKSASTRKIREKYSAPFSWQSGYHDHIIRNQKSLIRIEQYIRENPDRWNDDKYHC